MSNPHSASTASKNHYFQWATEFCLPPTEPAYLVRGVLDLDSTSFIFGDSKAGKSFVAIDRACHVANGMRWLGRKTKAGIVLYIAGEGANGLRKRVVAWHEYHSLPISPRLAFRTVPTALCEPKAVTELIALIHEFLADMDAMPVLIEIDTLAKNFGAGYDENSAKDMAAFVAGMDALRVATGAAVSTIHHPGHGDKSRGAGSKNLPSGVDFSFKVEKSGESVSNFVTTMSFEKVKDDETPKPVAWTWKLQAVPWTELDDDDRVRPVNSIVLVPTAHIEAVKVKPLTGRQQKALDILRQLFDEARENLTADDRDPGDAKVSLKHWSAAVSKFESDSGNRSRIRNELEALKLIKISDAYIELV